MFGLPLKSDLRLKPRLIASKTVSALSSTAAEPDIIPVPTIGALEIQGDPAGVSYYVDGDPDAGGVGPFTTFRGDMIPAPPSGQLGLYQSSGTGTIRIYHWPPEIAAIRLAAAAAAAMSGGSISVNTELPAAALLADNTATPTAPAVGAFLMGYDGATWDMIRSRNGAVATCVSDADALVYAEVISPSDNVAGQLALSTWAHNAGWDGSTWDRLRTYAADADDLTSPTLGQLGTIGFNFGYDPTDGNWDRLYLTGADTGALLPGRKGLCSLVDDADCASTGAKLTYTVPAGKDALAIKAWLFQTTNSGGIVYQLQVVRSGVTYVVKQVSPAQNATEEFSITGLQASDAIRWNCTSAVASATADMGISSEELR